MNWKFRNKIRNQGHSVGYREQVYPDQPRRIYNLNSIIDFGKYKGFLLSDVIRAHPDYIEWCTKSLPWFEVDLSDYSGKEGISAVWRVVIGTKKNRKNQSDERLVCYCLSESEASRIGYNLDMAVPNYEYVRVIDPLEAYREGKWNVITHVKRWLFREEYFG